MVESEFDIQSPGFRQYIELDFLDDVAIVKLNASATNILNQQFRKYIRGCFEYLGGLDDIRSIVLTGDQNFCAGADIKEFDARMDREVATAHCRNGHTMMLTLLTMKVPVIAAVEGFCLGGGLELALACDFRVVADDAKLGLPEIERGVFPGTGGLYLLDRLVGPARAKRIALEGKIYSADSSELDGIIDQRSSPSDSFSVALAFAKELASKPSGSVQRIKQLIDYTDISIIRSYLNEEESEYVSCFQLHDAKEGAESFLEKRQPSWTHS